MNLSQQEIEKIKTFFADKPVKKVYLFGSYARGEADEDSDVDLLVDFDDSKKRLSLFDVLRLKEGLEQLLRRNVELVEESLVYGRFRPYIDKDKLKLFEA